MYDLQNFKLLLQDTVFFIESNVLVLKNKVLVVNVLVLDSIVLVLATSVLETSPLPRLVITCTLLMRHIYCTYCHCWYIIHSCKFLRHCAPLITKQIDKSA